MVARPWFFTQTLHCTVLVWLTLIAAPPVVAGKIGVHIGFHGGHYGISYGFGHFGYRHHRRHGHHRHYRGRHHGTVFGYFPYAGHVHGYRHSSHYQPPHRRIDKPAPPKPRVVAVFNGGDGWALLREGRMRDAQAAFGGEAARRPRDAKPKAGFAIASAAAGELDMGAWAMRRALHLDENALHFVPVDEEMNRTAIELIDEYAMIEGQNTVKRDAAFMRAALHYLLGEGGSARVAMDAAVALGERNPAADVLDRLIGRLPTNG